MAGIIDAVRRSKRSTRGSRGRTQLPEQAAALPLFSLNLSVSPIKPVTKRSRKKALKSKTNSSGSLVDPMIDTSTLEKHSEVVFITQAMNIVDTASCDIGCSDFSVQDISAYQSEVVNMPLPPSDSYNATVNQIVQIHRSIGSCKNPTLEYHDLNHESSLPLEAVVPSYPDFLEEVLIADLSPIEMEPHNSTASTSEVNGRDVEVPMAIAVNFAPEVIVLSQPSRPSKSGLPSSEFFVVDESILERVLNDKEDPSQRVNQWCRNRFDAWRKARGIDTNKTIEMYNLPELREILPRYFLEVCKKSGERYPSESLHNLYNAFNRIICKEQRSTISRTKVEEPMFDISSNPHFVNVNKAVSESMMLSVKAGANKGRKKSKMLSYDDELKILSHPSHQITFPSGLLKRLVYYCTCVFLIRGDTELYAVLLSDFKKEENNAGFTYIKYDERTSKNYKASLKRYAEEQFRPVVFSYDPDVILTFLTLRAHYPPDLLERQNSHLLLSPIQNPLTPIWFKVKNNNGVKEGMNLGINQVRSYLKCMAREAGVTGRVTNKSGRTTAVTRMSMAGVPRNVMAEVTGHRALNSLDKYDESLDLQVQASQLASRIPYSISKSGEKQNQRFDHYKEVVTNQYHLKQVGDMLSSDPSSELAPLPVDIARINPVAVSSTMSAIGGVHGHANSSNAIVASEAQQELDDPTVYLNPIDHPPCYTDPRAFHIGWENINPTLHRQEMISQGYRLAPPIVASSTPCPLQERVSGRFSTNIPKPILPRRSTPRAPSVLPTAVVRPTGQMTNFRPIVRPNFQPSGVPNSWNLRPNTPPWRLDLRPSMSTPTHHVGCHRSSAHEPAHLTRRDRELVCVPAVERETPRIDLIPDVILESMFDEVDRLSQDRMNSQNSPVVSPRSKGKIPIVELPQATSEFSTSEDGGLKALQVDTVEKDSPIVLKASSTAARAESSDTNNTPENRGGGFGGIRTLNLNIMNVQDFHEVWKVLQK